MCAGARTRVMLSWIADSPYSSSLKGITSASWTFFFFFVFLFFRDAVLFPFRSSLLFTTSPLPPFFVYPSRIATTRLSFPRIPFLIETRERYPSRGQATADRSEPISYARSVPRRRNAINLDENWRRIRSRLRRRRFEASSRMHGTKGSAVVDDKLASNS